MLNVVEGDLFDAKEKYIVHQVNCVTTRAAHLAYHMFKRYPYADVYSCRDRSMHFGWSSDETGTDYPVKKDKPGDIIVRGDGEDNRYVIALLGQYFPGKPRYPNSKLDGPKARQRYFHQALWKIAQMDSLDSVAFPWKISCGAAGGDWKIYLKIIERFADYVGNCATNKADVFIYKLPGQV